MPPATMASDGELQPLLRPHRPAEVMRDPTVVHALRRWCQDQPDKRLYTWLDHKGDEEQVWSYRDLERRADAICHALLQQWGCQRGDRVALMYMPGLDFIAAFFGCLCAGVTAVPVYPVDLRNFESGVDKFGRIVASCSAKLVLSHTSYLHMKALHAAKNFFIGSSSWPDGLEFKATDDLEPREQRATEYEPSPDELAFLQFTSGSTGDPKGVMLSHGNIVHNLGTIASEFGDWVPQTTVGVSWVPQYHDMGLIGVILMTLYWGSFTVLMSPITMLQNPLIWLKACDKYKAHITCGMDGLYAHAAKKIPDVAVQALDLSSLHVCMSGGEPVRFETIEAFSNKFAPAGLQRGACFPCLGMAENGARPCVILLGTEVSQTASCGQ